MKGVLTIVIIVLSYFSSCAVIGQSLNWAMSFGGDGNTERAGHVICHQDEILICGVSNSTNGLFSDGNQQDMWIMACDSTGTVTDVYNYGGSANEGAKSITPTIDGGYAVTGIGFSTDGDATGANNHGRGDFWVVKLDANFNIEWQQMYGGSSRDDPQSIIQTSDGNFVITGHTTSSDGDVSGFHKGSPVWNDIWVIKVDTKGVLIWQRCIGGTEDDASWSVIETPTSYVLTGHSQSSDGDISTNYGNRDLLVASLSKSTGGINWVKTYGGSEMDTGLDLIYTQRNTIAVTGHANSGDIDVVNRNGQAEFWYLDIDTSGNIISSKTFGSPGTDVANEIHEANKNRYLLSGRAATGGSAGGDVLTIYGNTDAWVIVIDSLGNLLSEQNYGGSLNDIFYAAAFHPEGDLIAAGQTASDDFDLTENMGGNDWFVASISYKNLTVSSHEVLNSSSGLFEVHPNPSSGDLYINITEEGIGPIQLLDSNGRLIQNVNEGVNNLNLPRGICFLKGYNRHQKAFQIEKLVIQN